MIIKWSLYDTPIWKYKNLNWVGTYTVLLKGIITLSIGNP